MGRAGQIKAVAMRRFENAAIGIVFGAVTVIACFLAGWWAGIPFVPESRLVRLEELQFATHRLNSVRGEVEVVVRPWPAAQVDPLFDVAIGKENVGTFIPQFSEPTIV